MSFVSSLDFNSMEILDLPEVRNPNSEDEKILELRKKIEELGTLLGSYKQAQMTQNVVDLTQIAKQTIPATIQIECMKTANTLFTEIYKQSSYKATASGFVISPDGYIVTCQHVIDGAEKIKVIFGQNGHKFSSKLIGADPETDIALLKIDAEDLPYLHFADSDQVQVGERAILVGNPLGYRDLLTLGCIGGKLASASGVFGDTTQRDVGVYADYFVTDAASNYGNSGGALLNSQGNVIGVLSRGFPQDSNGASVMSNTASRVVDELRQNGHVTRGWLGARLWTMNDDLAAMLHISDVTTPMLIVTDLLKNSPAQIAGLQKGDAIVAYNDISITTEGKFFADIAMKIPAGSELKLSIIREGEPMDVLVVLGSRIVNVSTPVGELGIRIENLEDEKFYWCNIHSAIQGVLVSEVRIDSGTGLRPADVITGVILGIGNEKSVKNVDDFLDILENLGDQKDFYLVVCSPDRSRQRYYPVHL